MYRQHNSYVKSIEGKIKLFIHDGFQYNNITIQDGWKLEEAFLVTYIQYEKKRIFFGRRTKKNEQSNELSPKYCNIQQYAIPFIKTIMYRIYFTDSEEVC